MDEANADPRGDLYPEVHLCISCLAENLPTFNFCHDCGAPIHPIAATVPFQDVWAEGWILKTAAARPNWMAFVYFGLTAAGLLVALAASIALGVVDVLLGVLFYHTIVWCALSARAVTSYLGDRT